MESLAILLSLEPPEGVLFVFSARSGSLKILGYVPSYRTRLSTFLPSNSIS